MDYFKMICEAVFLNKDIVSLLKENQAKAKENGVGYIEFFENCDTVYRNLKGELNKQIEDEKQLILEELKYLPSDISLDDLEDRLKRYFDFIRRVKNDEAFIEESFFNELSFPQKLYAHQIEKIESDIKTAKQDLYRENSKEIKDSKNLHKDIFKYNSFRVFEAFVKRKDLKVYNHTDLSFLYTYLKRDNLLKEKWELSDFKDWILSEIFKDSSEQEIRNLRKNLHEKSKEDPKRFRLYEDLKNEVLRK